jgi:hypothetical protein
MKKRVMYAIVIVVLIIAFGLFFLLDISSLQKVQPSPAVVKTEQDLITLSQGGFVEEDRGLREATFLPGWPVSTGTYGWTGFPPHVQDIDKDASKEVVFAGGRGVFVMNVLGENKPGWPFLLAQYPSFLFSPAIANLNYDQYLEIAGGTQRIEQYVFDYSGNIVSGWPVNGEYEFSESSVVGDIDGDGRMEIIDGHRYPGEVYAWKEDGSLMPGWPKEVQGSSYIRGLALGDLDKNGKSDVLATDSMYVYIWKGDGTNFNSAWPKLLQPWSQQLGGGTYYNNPIRMTLADVNKDRQLEIVVYTYNFAYYNNQKRIWVHVLKTDGSELSGFPVEIPYLYGWDSPSAQLVVANIDSDPNLEIIVPSLTKLIIVQSDGSYTLLPEGNIPGADYIGFRSCAVADINADGVVEIISPIMMNYDPYSYGEEDGRIYAWHADGEVIDGFPINLPWPPSSTLTVEDVDKDGKVDLWGGYEVFGMIADAGIYALDLDTNYVSNKVEWGTWGYDKKNTMCYKCTPEAVPYEIAKPVI